MIQNRKNIILSLLLCAIMIFMTSCGPAEMPEPSDAPSQQTEEPQIDATQTEPTQEEPNPEGTTQTEPNQEEDTQTESTQTTPSQTNPPQPDPSDIQTAQEVAHAMGLGLNLGNTMEAYSATNCEKITYEWIPKIGENTPQNYETCWGAVVTTQEVINGIKEAGFNTVRIPVFWGNMMENDGSYTINPDYMNRVREIVDYCQKADLYAVINIHHFDEFIIRRNSLEDCEEIFTNLWTQIAEAFKDYPYNVIFEGYNEYLGGSQFDENGNLTELSKSDGYQLTNALNQVFVDAVRATSSNNAERVLIVSGYWTNIDLTTSNAFVMPTDTAQDKLMVSVHYVDNMMYWINQIGGDNWLNYIDSQCQLLISAFSSKGIPVFMGETTAIYPKSNFDSAAKHRDSTECLEIVLRKLLDCGFVPVIWDVNDNFYSRTQYQVKSEADRELIKTLAEEINY